MTRSELEAAAEKLRAAVDLVEGEANERIERQAEQLERLATADRGPDHGRLARHMHALADIADDLDGEARELVTAARSDVSTYREGVEGV